MPVLQNIYIKRERERRRRITEYKSQKNTFNEIAIKQFNRNKWINTFYIKILIN